ncbi:hypothetical protein D3C87_1443690 [compost metagenome]
MIANRQRSPLFTGGPSYQARRMSVGTFPCRDVACANSKRTTASPFSGNPVTCPSTQRVSPSRLGAKRSSSADWACTQAQLKPNRKNAAGYVLNGNNIKPATGINHHNPTGGNAGKKRRASRPNASAIIPVRISPSLRVPSLGIARAGHVRR